MLFSLLKTMDIKNFWSSPTDSNYKVNTTLNWYLWNKEQLNLLDAATTDQDAHPRIWAPFVVVGEPGRIKKRTGSVQLQ